MNDLNAKRLLASLDIQNGSACPQLTVDGDRVRLNGTYEIEALVRAVLQAIREPSRQMVIDGRDVAAKAYGKAVSDDVTRLTWTTMIDAALAEQR